MFLRIRKPANLLLPGVFPRQFRATPLLPRPIHIQEYSAPHKVGKDATPGRSPTTLRLTSFALSPVSHF